MTLNVDNILYGRYRIDATLGQGGMGTVYKAWDLNLNIPVAIKENLDTSPEALKQFNREAVILATLAHPSLPRVTDYFLIQDQGQYLIMDFVQGEDLASMLNRLGRLPEPQVLQWIGQIIDALAYLHSLPSPIIHRDVKPGNIKVRPDGRAVLVDFGIAKIYDPNLATTVGAKAISPGYSPPEQYGGGETDARSDIYALGATLYHLLTGKTPPESVQRVVSQDSMPPPRRINAEISPAVEETIMKSVEIPTTRRFQSIEEMRVALNKPPNPEDPVAATRRSPLADESSPGQVQSETASTSEPSSAPPEIAPARPERKFPAWTLIAAGVLFACLLLSVGGFYFVYRLLTPGEATPEVALVSPTRIEATQALTASPRAVPTDTPPASPSPVPPTQVNSVKASSYSPMGSLAIPDSQAVRGVAEKDGYVFTLNKVGELQIFDMNAANPGQSFELYSEPAGKLSLDAANGLLRNRDTLYAYGNTGIQVIDISDPSNPSVGAEPYDLSVINLIQYEDYLVATGNERIVVYDASQPGAPRLVSRLSTGSGSINFSAAIYADMLYVGRFESEKGRGLMMVYDFKDPSYLQLVQRIDTSELAYHILVMGENLITCASDHITLWDLSRIDYPQFLSSERGKARVCLADGENLIANGLVFKLGFESLDRVQDFDSQMGLEDASEDVQRELLPYGSAVNPQFVFLAQSSRVLMLARLSE
jgi:serine/threonine protein kinase